NRAQSSYPRRLSIWANAMASAAFSSRYSMNPGSRSPSRMLASHQIHEGGLGEAIGLPPIEQVGDAIVHGLRGRLMIPGVLTLQGEVEGVVALAQALQRHDRLDLCP